MRVKVRHAALVVVGALVCGAVGFGYLQVASTRDEAAAVVQARPTEADVCFVAMMVPHHQQAVEMSEVLLAKDGVWERGQRFARYVEATQGQEIRTMEAWLGAWDVALDGAAEDLGVGVFGAAPSQGPDDTATDAAGNGGHGGHGGPSVDEVALPSCTHAHGTRMQGMVAEEDMAVLRQADAAEAQRLYLELMLPHHEGAVAMADRALAEADNDFVRSSAAHVLQEQVSELESIEAMVAALDAGDLDLAEEYVEGGYQTYDSTALPSGVPAEGADGP